MRWGVAAGGYNISFDGVAPHCTLWGDLPRGQIAATVVAGRTLSIEVEVACFGDVAYEGAPGLHLFSPAGIETVLQPRGTFGGWSPDGTRILWWGPDGSSNEDLYVHDAVTATTTRLTTDPEREYWPSWSPDGQQIVFIRDRPLGARDPVRINADSLVRAGFQVVTG